MGCEAPPITVHQIVGASLLATRGLHVASERAPTIPITLKPYDASWLFSGRFPDSQGGFGGRAELLGAFREVEQHRRNGLGVGDFTEES